MKYEKNFYQIKDNQEIFDLIKEEKDFIGYYNLVFQDTKYLKDYAKQVSQKHIVVVGIGGSIMGTKAIYEFLLSSSSFTKKMHFLETTDPLNIKQQLKFIDLKDAFFIIASKSGTTIETIAVFKYLSSLYVIDKNNSAIISDETSPLFEFAKNHNIQRFILDANIGGRFSVFSAISLLPLAIIGVDIDKIMQGCKEVYDSFFNQKSYYKDILEKARFFVENKHRFNIHIVFSYSTSLEGFNRWYIQLWGESLGKLNINQTRQSLTPIGLIGPNDQHSFLQLLIDGNRDKIVTFIKINDFKSEIKIPKNTLKDFKELSYIDDIDFQDLINHQANATIKSIDMEKDIPYDVISIDKVDEISISKLMFSYQLLTSCVGKFMQVNTYDQPGVEQGKIILKKILQK